MVISHLSLYDEQTSCSCHLGNPVWTETENETLYQQLAQSSEVQVPDDLTLSENSPPPEIGRWGEALVNSYLKQVQVRCRGRQGGAIYWQH